ncbi:thiosulfate/3-mercaptopyruvate sulfurtransferase [Andreprevotia lacus DSM 23236]|jgi:thiosulfate/3-mercaptopyruvate sulfurtransferase|uniref:Thiosulfate/3-mercaptopyruvate sulfurtransferase n=1 Tax=Andreprevotia lacus DSM 23236 TaxID=1121001 RepID=A0A1W1XGM2_9NEIS|nr:sulfurtransferase [Andreprevotia lacus]SMC23145.1 thiosulfate/3-mercaptopyruvate sulfurtransferase [Andreprevotia lacus DSM 23236]
MLPLISTSELLAQLDDPKLVIVDCRHDLANPEAGRNAYAEAHIAGARFAHLDLDLSGAKTGSNGRHPLPDADVLAHWLGQQGISNDSRVVAYDASGGMFAARLWWLLQWLGHDAVQVLDGGWAAWQAAGDAIDAASVEPQSTTFEPALRNEIKVDMAQVRANLDDAQFLLVDARSPDRYAGRGETLDPVGGHIPGAGNRFFQHNLAADGRFKPAEALRNEWQAVLGDVPHTAIVHQCGSGVTACHNLLALAVAGLPGGRLYPGSWSEWCAHAENPVAV